MLLKNNLCIKPNKQSYLTAEMVQTEVDQYQIGSHWLQIDHVQKGVEKLQLNICQLQESHLNVQITIPLKHVFHHNNDNHVEDCLSPRSFETSKASEYDVYL